MYISLKKKCSIFALGAPYLLHGNNQCRKFKLGLIRTLVIHILLIYSTDTHKNRELTLIKQTLKMNGYPQHLISRDILEGEIVIKKMLNRNSDQTRNSSVKKKIFFIFTYYGAESTIFTQRIKSIIHKYLLNSH